MTEVKETPAAQAPEEKSPTTEEVAAAAATNGDEAAAAATNGEGTAETNGASETNGDDKEEEKPEPPKEMRAIVLTAFGGLKGIKVLKKPEPSAQPGEVLIRVKACGLNFQDLIVRLGAIDSPPKTPCILGFECAGVVEAVGEGVTSFEIGDRVVALPDLKAWAELVTVSEKFVYKIPDEMEFTEAAAITLTYLVAHILVYDLASVRPGNSLLLHSAGGGVGLAVAQLCKIIGNVTLFGIATKGKHEELQSKGLITHLIERGTDYLNEVRKVSPQGVDIVLDCLCGEECSRGYSLLKPMGKYILYGSANVVTGETKSIFSVARSWWQVDKVSPIKLFDENKSLMGFNLRHLLYQQDGADYVRNSIEKVFALHKEGKIELTCDSTWAFEDIAEAMQKLHDRKNIGKLVLDPAKTPKPKPATPAKGKSKDKKQASEDKNGDKDKQTDSDDAEKKEEEKAEEKVTNGDHSEEKAAETKATNGDATEKEKESS